MLRHDLVDEADQWLTKLESLLPDDLSVAMLRARWLHSAGQDAKIEPTMEALSKKLSQKSPLDKQQETEVAQRIGGLYSAVGQHEAAQRWYRRLVELAPDRYEPLAVELARQDHMREAIELCQKAAQSDNSAQPALVLATVLMLGKPTADDIQVAETTLSKTAANHKDSVDLLYALANVQVVQQKIDEAVRLYQQVLTLKPTHVATLNNLATLLGEQPGKRQEALEYVEPGNPNRRAPTGVARHQGNDPGVRGQGRRSRALAARGDGKAPIRPALPISTLPWLMTARVTPRRPAKL